MLKKLFKKSAIILASALIPFGCILATDYNCNATITKELVSQNEQKSLPALLAERLMLAQEYAKVHWNQKLPIDNPQQEKIALESIEKEATNLGLDPIQTGVFFQAQNEAFKMVLIEHFDIYVNNNIDKHELTKDQIELNQKLSEIDTSILQSLKENQTEIATHKEILKEQVSKNLQKEGFSRDVIDSSTHF